MMRKIVFVTGTRADFGKIKSLIKCVEDVPNFDAYIYVTGMHLLHQFGDTYTEVLKEGFENVYIAYGTNVTSDMGFNLGNTVSMLSGYISNVKPDMLVVHGDRTDALAGAIVGAFNNILVAHIEGGEVSGTIDESIRHAISKFAHVHFVCSEEAKVRLIQMGEESNRIFVIGSPDIDIMLSENLPLIEESKERYEIAYDKYGILMYHPVTTEYEMMSSNIRCIINALKRTNKKYIIIYPNNDLGSQFIISEYQHLKKESQFRIFPSLRFEHFLTLLKNADFIVGNSSAGIREACVYGIPAIDIGSRQQGRYSDLIKNIVHVEHDELEIVCAIENIDKYRVSGTFYGDGSSTEKFMTAIMDNSFWSLNLQKRFIDM